MSFLLPSIKTLRCITFWLKQTNELYYHDHKVKAVANWTGFIRIEQASLRSQHTSQSNDVSDIWT